MTTPDATEPLDEAQAAPAAPAPRRAATSETISCAVRTRHLDCANYGACLEHAVREGWEGFACAGCAAYQPEERHLPAPPDPHLVDHHG